MLLGIDTSTRIAALALFDEESGFVAESRFGLTLAHSETLMPSLVGLMESSGKQLHHLSGIAVARGPGSFTGLRVALATAKGLAFSTGIPIYPVSTLEAMAHPHRYGALAVCPVLDARKDEVYAALYRPRPDRLDVLMPEAALSPEELLDLLDEPVLLLGEGSARHRPLFVARLGDHAHFAPLAVFHPGALSVCELAIHQYIEAGISPPDPLSITPSYLRAPEAERKWKEKNSS